MKSNVPPAAAVRDMIIAGVWTQMVHVAARLGIADLLKDGPKTSDELAKLTQTHPQALYRLLRGLASGGVFAEIEGRRFELTPMAQCLRKDAENSVWAYAVWGGSPCWWQPWGNLFHVVKTGKPAFEHTFGMKIFEYFGRNREMADVFNTFMSERIVPIAKAVCKAYDFSHAKKVVDVGGGGGGMLAAILKAYPNLRGVVQDLPAVIESKGLIIEKMGVADRCELVGASFFDIVPAGGDIYILSAIIHDWDDENSIKILQNCCKNMHEGSKLLLIEFVIQPGNEPQFGKLTDLNMMVLAGGLERTAKQFEDLLAAAGLNLARIIPTETPLCIIESTKV